MCHSQCFSFVQPLDGDRTSLMDKEDAAVATGRRENQKNN